MIQEIITYMIIGSAITLAVLKIIKKFKGRNKSAKTDYKNESFSLQHNCSDCSAECMLRDTITPLHVNGTNSCTRIDVKSD